MYMVEYRDGGDNKIPIGKIFVMLIVIMLIGLIYKSYDPKPVEIKTSPQNAAKYKFPNKFPGYDFPGNDLEYYKAELIEDCAYKCDNTLGCVGYVSDKDLTGKLAGCYLKSRFGLAFNPNSQRDTYYKNTRFYQNQPNYNYLSNDIAVYKGPLETCPLVCDTTSSCLGYVVDRNANICMMKSRLAGGGFISPNNDVYLAQSS